MQENQPSTESMTYPEKGTLNRLLFKLPLVLWRMGLGPYLSHPSRGGSKMLVITTRGRNSGLARHTMLSYSSLSSRDYVISGWGDRSDWYQNVLADALVTIQVGKRIYAARAYRVSDLEEFQQVTREMFRTGGDSHFEPWLASHGVEFSEEDMVANRERLYLIGLQLVDHPGPAPLPADLLWVWGFLALVLLVMGWLLFGS